MNQIVCANVIEKEGKFLLVKETLAAAKEKYNFPAGRLEPGESLVSCAAREAEEETGFKVRAEKLICVSQFHSNSDEVIVFFFKSSIVGGKATASAEIPEVKFFSYAELKRLAAADKLRHRYFVDVVNLFKAGRLMELDVVKEVK